MNAAALDSCLTAANSSSVAKGWGGGTQNPRPTPNDSDNPFPNAPHTTLGQTATASGGGEAVLQIKSTERYSVGPFLKAVVVHYNIGRF